MGRAGRELQVQLLLDDLQPAVVALSETEVPEEDLAIFKNYKAFYPKATPKRGYRLLLLVREDLLPKLNPTVIKSTTMEIWVELETDGGTVLVGSIYRQWTGAMEEEDLAALDESIRELSDKFGRLIIVGDMNLDYSRTNDHAYYRRKLLLAHLECLNVSGLAVANELDMSPTFHSHGSFEDKDGSTRHKSSVLDHVYYRGFARPSFRVLPIAMTDHRPTLARFVWKQEPSGLRSLLRRNFKAISTTAICWAINAEALSAVFAMDDVESIHGVIISEITAALDIVAPLQVVQVKERKSPLYLSAETRGAIKERDLAATKGSHSEYRRLRNKASRLVRRDRLASNVEALQKEGFCPRSIWQLANTVTGRSTRSALPMELVDEVTGEHIKGDEKLADCVNRFYIDKIDKIRERIDREMAKGPAAAQDQQQRQQQQQQRQQERFRFRAPSEKEVTAILMSLNNTQALGIDGVPVSVLKQLSPIIAAPLAHLVKMSFKSSRIPDGFKRASVIPLHKKSKPPQLPSSYRPVSILAAVSKVLERVVLQQVSPHLAPLLPPTQFGFRPRRSTSSAIAYSHSCWSAARARGRSVAVAGYDLSAAFDTIDVDMVSAKLKSFGIVEEENLWFHDYLSNRKQQVQYNGGRSSFRDVRFGVPQGSILGPLLFLVLVADLPDKLYALSGGCNDVEVGVSTYADDTLCWVAGKDPLLVGTKLEEISAAIVTYASKNYLALNESKTQVLWSPSRGMPIRVGSCLVTPADRLEVLGVSFDKQLSPTPHVNSLITSAKAMTAIARRLSLHLPTDLLKSVMGSLLNGKIGYACIVLPPRLSDTDPLSTHMSQLQVCVNNVARATIGSSKSEKIRVEDLLHEAGFPSINRLVVYSIAMECWRALNLRDVHDGPLNPLGNILSPPSSPCSGRTRAAASGCIPPPSKYQVESFSWWAYTCWNSSPSLRAAATVSAAKRAANELAASAPL